MIDTTKLWIDLDNSSHEACVEGMKSAKRKVEEKPRQPKSAAVKGGNLKQDKGKKSDE